MMTHDCAPEIEPPRFTIDLEEGEKHQKPLPYVLKTKNKSGRVKLATTYPKFEIEFFDTIKSCAQYIDEIVDLQTRIKYTNDLNKIFIIRHHGTAMKLFRELLNLKLNRRTVNFNG